MIHIALQKVSREGAGDSDSTNEERCDAETITFLSFAVDTFTNDPKVWESFGNWNLGKEEDKVVRHLRQSLGILTVTFITLGMAQQA